MHIPGQLKSFTYLGGKFSILPFLYKNFPEDIYHFVDVTGGSGVVLLNMKPHPIETYNDINGKIVNFFKVLRDFPEEIMHKLYFTPHSKQEYDDAWFDEKVDQVEQARRFFIRTQQSIFAAGAQNRTKGWATSTNNSRCAISEKTNRWINGIDGLCPVIDRLRTVQIENRDFRKIIKTYDQEGTFFYFDGPYLQSTRSNTKYEFDFERQDYHDLQRISKKLAGRIAISHYEDDFMDELFVVRNGFRKIIGPQRKNTLSDKVALECLYVNY